MLRCHCSSEIGDGTVWKPLHRGSGPAAQRFLESGRRPSIPHTVSPDTNRPLRHRRLTHETHRCLQGEWFRAYSTSSDRAPTSLCARPSPRQGGVFITPIPQVRTLGVGHAGYLPKGTLRGLGVPRAFDDRLSLSCCKKYHRWAASTTGTDSSQPGAGQVQDQGPGRCESLCGLLGLQTGEVPPWHALAPSPRLPALLSLSFAE